MEQYLNLVDEVLTRGEKRTNRTNIPTIANWDLDFRHDMRDGFPLLTAKKVNYRSTFGEFEGLIKGVTSAADFRQFGTKVWDQNANEDKTWVENGFRRGVDDLGPIYGKQWREWEDVQLIDNATLDDSARIAQYIKAGYEPVITGSRIWALRRKTDQLRKLVEGLKNNPNSRYHIVTAWNPGILDQVALPACHSFFQCFVSNDGHLDLKMYQRSADLFLGVPFNIASYGVMLETLAKVTGLKARRLTITFGDIHIYTNHIPQCLELLKRDTRKLPELTISNDLLDIDDVKAEHFQIHGYDPSPALPASMAIG